MTNILIDIIGSSADDVAMRYPGGKGKCFQHIINILPKHSVYIETHLGGGAVLLHKRAATQSYGIDVDPGVIAWWRTNYPDLATYIVGDALTVLRDFRFTGSELIYCDPPYLPSTRKRSRVYRYDLGEQDHVDLLALLRQIPCCIALSGYPSVLYRNALSDWNEFTFRAKAHDTTRDECIWTNYAMPNYLHDTRFLGNTFRERQDRKRRLTRIQQRVATLSIQEQHALFEWLEAQLSSSKEKRCRRSHS